MKKCSFCLHTTIKVRVSNSCFPSADPSVSNIQVTRLTLLCDEAPAPMVLDLTGALVLFH